MPASHGAREEFQTIAKNPCPCLKGRSETHDEPLLNFPIYFMARDLHQVHALSPHH